MNELIHIEQKDGELYADSRMVAQVLGVQHQNIRELLTDKESALGKVRFETGAKEGSKTGQVEKYALLTERQCLLLITMVRNSAEALEAKTALVDAFMAMRDKLTKKPQSMLELFAQSVAAMQEQQKRLEIQDQRITALGQGRIPVPANAQEEYTIPTALGKMFDPPKTAQAINAMLKNAGLQYRAGGEWIPTREGEKWSKCHPMTLENGRVIYQVYWQRKVLEAVS